MRRARGRSIAAALLLGCLSLAACAEDAGNGNGTGTGGNGGTATNGGTDPTEETPEARVGLAFDVGGEGDQSFNDSAVAGLQQAIDEFGIESQKVSPNDDGSNRAELLAQLAEQGFNPVIAVGFAYDEVIADVAAEFPDTTFAQVDGSNAVFDGSSKGPNHTGLLFAEEQGSFLAGVAAALKTETDHIGFVGGVDIGLIQKFEAGYVAGATAVNPDIVVDVQYISPAGDFSGFGDPARGKIVAQGMYDGGADIVYHAAGGSGGGVFEAAAEADALAIGVDSDQYNTVGDPALQEVIMTSMLKRVDVAVYEFISSFIDGTVEGGTDIIYDLEVDGVGLATSGGQIDDIQDEIDSYKQQIIDGEIEVPTTP
ncbi:MAG: BMP family ABC transporter substrate-binding protein [Geodermatophilaceae bacterium]|nr:BMP family ABC transporter substrate-binding protein [Geodermatophilaceae bacterium]MDQ3465202.1 BMP family ABC transporter substrate-binding protein [Actinomycetota bacterium]